MSEESRQKWDRWPAEFRQRALERMKPCQNVKGLAKELGVSRQLLYWWKQQAEGRKKTTGASQTEDPVERGIRELEQEVEESRQRKGKSGVTASSPESAGGCKRKVD